MNRNTFDKLSPQERKEEAVRMLREQLTDDHCRDITAVDERLLSYLQSVAGDPDMHNYYEVLGALRFIRLFDTYEFNTRRVKQVIRMREGIWKRDGKAWRYVSGGLKCPATIGAKVYRWEPFQVFVLASVFGFTAWIDTELTLDDRDELLPTERATDDGRIEDLRRLCTDFTFYAPRKTDKTGLSAYIQVWFFLMEDANAEIYCCANSAEQSKILYRRTRYLLHQLDKGNRIRQIETICDWRPQYKSFRDSVIMPLSAGGKTKDGMFAQLCCADEFGSAAYTKDKSDMKMLVDVIQSSMGPRREPLTFTTTTAGRIIAGPFIEKLDGLHRMLEDEIIERDEVPQVSQDRTLCLLLEPDSWERDENILLSDKNIRSKINPMLGKIVQHAFYEDEIVRGRRDGDLAEVISKLFNVYASDRVEEWVKPDTIRELQQDITINDLDSDDGWEVYTGFDFSMGDDIYAASFLATRWNEELEQDEFFADLNAWVSEEAIKDSPLLPLYERWAENGWLTVVPGWVFPTTLFLKRVAELGEHLHMVAYGYDPYKAKQPVNDLSAWVIEEGADPKQCIIPVRQNFATYNPMVLEMDMMIKSNPPMIHFSKSPLWPWQFGNARIAVSTDGMDNRKVVKSGPDAKVDNVQSLMNALYCYDFIDGQVK